MVQQDGRVLFSRSALLNAVNRVTVFRKGAHLGIHGIVPSGSLALSYRTNYFTLHEHCDQKYTRLVTV